MARNQLSLAHNGNVNSPELLSPTQGEIWLGAGCIFPNPNSERELARLKSCPLLAFSLEQFTALPIHYSSRSSKQVSLTVWKAYSHTYAHTCWAYTHIHTPVSSAERWTCPYYDRWHLEWIQCYDCPSMFCLISHELKHFQVQHLHIFYICIHPKKGYQTQIILDKPFFCHATWGFFDHGVTFMATGTWWNVWLTCHFQRCVPAYSLPQIVTGHAHIAAIIRLAPSSMDNS